MRGMESFLRSNSSNDIRDKLQKQNDFLVALVQYVRITVAAQKSKVKISEVNEWKRDDLMFRQRFEQAEEAANDILEDEAIRRAFKGYTVPIYQAGKEVGTRRVYSDTLMVRILEARHKNYKKVDDTKDDEKMSQLLVLPTNGRELTQAEPEPNRLEMPIESPLDELETILLKAKEQGGGLFENLNTSE
jgi:hypothetical protein